MNEYVRKVLFARNWSFVLHRLEKYLGFHRICEHNEELKGHRSDFHLEKTACLYHLVADKWQKEVGLFVFFTSADGRQFYPKLQWYHSQGRLHLLDVSFSSSYTIWRHWLILEEVLHEESLAVDIITNWWHYHHMGPVNIYWNTVPGDLLLFQTFQLDYLTG